MEVLPCNLRTRPAPEIGSGFNNNQGSKPCAMPVQKHRGFVLISFRHAGSLVPVNMNKQLVLNLVPLRLFGHQWGSLQPRTKELDTGTQKHRFKPQDQISQSRYHRECLELGPSIGNALAVVKDGLLLLDSEAPTQATSREHAQYWGTLTMGILRSANTIGAIVEYVLCRDDF